MSCGLGAIILVFMLVKFNVETEPVVDNRLAEELAELQLEQQALQTEIRKAAAEQAATIQGIEQASQSLARAEQNLTRQRQTISDQDAQLKKLKADIEETKTAQKEDVIEDPQAGEETYVMGLKVEGQKIAILVDSSSSMTDEVLLDVIRRKNRSDADKKAGPKWRRTIATVKWLIARLPKASSVYVNAFNDRATTIGPAGWVSAQDSQAITGIVQELEAIVPEGATNLHAGLDTVGRMQPTNVYLITDGLPTQGQSNYKSLNPFASCSALWGQSNVISGACRIKLFAHTLQAGLLPPSVPVNVILLPIEGDPDAAKIYWSWSATTGGLMISPAENWP